MNECNHCLEVVDTINQDHYNISFQKVIPGGTYNLIKQELYHIGCWRKMRG
jgi:hypothetical protein